MEANKELAKYNTLPSLPDAKEYGIDLGEEDLIMPRLQLVQPTSQHEGAGKYLLTLTGDLFDEIDVVFFKNVRGRVMFDPDMSAARSICGSTDRLVPSVRYESPQAERCVECKFSNREYFEEIQIGKEKVKMMCSETQILTGMIVDTLTPFVMTFRRTGLMPINVFLSGVRFDAVKYKKPLCCFPAKLTTTIPSKAITKYYIPVITRLGMLEKEEFTAMMQKYSAYDINKSFDDDENNSSGTPSTPPPPDDEAAPF